MVRKLSARREVDLARKEPREGSMAKEMVQKGSCGLARAAVVGLEMRHRVVIPLDMVLLTGDGQLMLSTCCTGLL